MRTFGPMIVLCLLALGILRPCCPTPTVIQSSEVKYVSMVPELPIVELTRAQTINGTMYTLSREQHAFVFTVASTAP